MPIPVIEEDVNSLKAWGLGLERIRELCRFCAARTPHWHRASNQPVCEPCASTHTEDDLQGLAGRRADASA
jgi:hypothetical protein